MGEVRVASSKRSRATCVAMPARSPTIGCQDGHEQDGAGQRSHEHPLSGCPDRAGQAARLRIRFRKRARCRAGGFRRELRFMPRRRRQGRWTNERQVRDQACRPHGDRKVERRRIPVRQRLQDDRRRLFGPTASQQRHAELGLSPVDSVRCAVGRSQAAAAFVIAAGLAEGACTDHGGAPRSSLRRACGGAKSNMVDRRIFEPNPGTVKPIGRAPRGLDR